MQSALSELWFVNRDGMLLVSMQQIAMANLVVWDHALQPIFSFLVGDSLHYFPFGSKLLKQAKQPARLHPKLRLLSQHQQTLADLTSLLTEPNMGLYCLDWKGEAVLALGISILHYRGSSECAWHSTRLGDMRTGEERRLWDNPVAFWCPDGTSVMLFGTHSFYIWCTNTKSLVADCRRCELQPEQDFGCAPRHLPSCSPDGRILAVLSSRCLHLIDIKSQVIVQTTRFPSEAKGTSLAWNSMGDKLTFTRGSSWHVLCFGHVNGMLEHGPLHG